MRTIIDFPKEQIEALDAYAKAKGISRAAAVRGFVATGLPPMKKKKIDWFKHPAFGSWKAPKGFDSVKYVQKLRSEWDHRSG